MMDEEKQVMIMCEKKKKSLGRQKIAIKKIENQPHRQVTFSKRRTGVFKKASELCILCGVDIAIVVFSPAGKAFSFGHPCVETVINRYLNQHDNQTSPLPFPHHHLHQGIELSVREQQQQKQYREVVSQLEVEKRRGETIEKLRKEEECGQWGRGCHQYWWDAPIEDMGLHELEQMRMKMEELRKEVAKRVDQMVMRRSSPSLYLADNAVEVNMSSI